LFLWLIRQHDAPFTANNQGLVEFLKKLHAKQQACTLRFARRTLRELNIDIRAPRNAGRRRPHGVGMQQKKTIAG
jgi:hypothetical protein